ncbi:MAG: HlyD family efflux transporter periplasmic adaptor subunit [Acidimicrobiia bacterium]|nr:HlyD family efflux transporter periplasmic adaptor subunit [Acidimicrobiia bacterium]
MDIPRKDANRRRWIRRIVVTAGLVIGIPALWIPLSRLKPAAPLVENTWPDQVKRGQMIRQVRGLGTLVAEETLWVPAMTDGRVERIHIWPGTEVEADTVIVTLNNPELMQSALEADYQVKAAEASQKDLKVQLDSQTLTQQAELARVESEYTQAKLTWERDEALFREGLIVELRIKLVRSTAQELEKRLAIEKERLKIKKDSVEAQLAVRRADIDRLRALYELRRTQVEALKVRAGADGVLQEMPLQVGQRVAAGTILAKVAQPARLKAELKVPETQAKDVVIGQVAEIDTRNGVIPGRVSRIDPAAREGTVVVDVRLEGELPAGARPDLSVDGTIEIERLRDVIYVGRPAFGQPNSTVSMFRIDRDGMEASRVQVKLGRASVNTIEVVEGLNVGDKVILSDMSAWESHDRVRLK